MKESNDIDLEELFDKLYGLWQDSGYVGSLDRYINELDIGVRFDNLFSKYTLIVVDWQKFLLGKIKYGI